jgi:ATP-dependent Clp protease adaptor protein ClpS
MAKRKKKFDVESLLNSIKPQNRIVVYNDAYNTFEWVIATFMEVLEHNYYQAEQCAHLIHTKGKCSVKEGDSDTLKPLAEMISSKGLKVKIE